MIKKILFVLSLMFLFSFVTGCGGGDQSSSNEQSSSSNSENSSEQSPDEESQNSDSNKIDAPADFTFAAASSGGFWYTLAGAMSEDIQKIFPDSSVTVVEGGSVSDLLGLGNGIYTVGLSMGQTVPQALEGTGPF